MADIVPENGHHSVSITMPRDLSGKTLNAQYFNLLDHSATTGGSTSGDVEGNEVTISTDVASVGLSPGRYLFEVTYDDAGTTREVLTDDLVRIVVIRDAQSV